MIAILALGSALLTSPGKDEIEIRKLCDSIVKATSAKDFKALKATTTPDFRQTDMEHKTVNRDQLMAGFARTFRQFQDMKTTYKILSLKANGNDAVGKIVWTINAKVIANGAAHTVTLTDTENDTFRKVNGRWLESRVVELDGKALLDGKPLQTGVSA